MRHEGKSGAPYYFYQRAPWALPECIKSKNFETAKIILQQYYNNKNNKNNNNDDNDNDNNNDNYNNYNLLVYVVYICVPDEDSKGSSNILLYFLNISSEILEHINLENCFGFHASRMQVISRNHAEKKTVFMN